MRRVLLTLITSALLSCANHPGSVVLSSVSENAAYQWVNISDSAEWSKSYNYQLFSWRDSLWVFHPDGVWNSANGSVWKKTSLTNAVNNQAFLDYVLFNDAIYGLGHFTGNIERFEFSPFIFRTVDGRHWDTIAVQSNLPDRFFYHPFVFNNRIWIIGGEDKNRKFGDTWHSADGVHWEKLAEASAFGPRSGSLVLNWHDSLFLLNDDIWTSANGRDWTEKTPKILAGQELFGYAATVWDDQLWLFGCNRNGLFSSQALYSSNGRDWKELAAPWSPRGGVCTAVFQDKIYLTGGKYGGLPNAPEFIYSNDLWVLEKKP